MLELESGAEATGSSKLSKCPSKLSISRSGGSNGDDHDGLWRQSSSAGFRRRTRRSAVASCLAPDPSSPPRLSLQQQQEPLLNAWDVEQPRLHRHHEQQDDGFIGCLPLRISPVSWLSSILSLASAPPPSTSGSGDSQRRHFVWRDIARRVLHQRRRRSSSSSIGRQGRSLPPDMAYVYDESSYAKNFDLGQESWHTVDEGFRRAAATEAQCRRSRSDSATLLHCGCRLASLDPAILTENL